MSAIGRIVAPKVEKMRDRLVPSLLSLAALTEDAQRMAERARAVESPIEALGMLVSAAGLAEQVVRVGFALFGSVIALVYEPAVEVVTERNEFVEHDGPEPR